MHFEFQKKRSWCNKDCHSISDLFIYILKEGVEQSINFQRITYFSLKDAICEGADKNVSVLNVDHLPHTQEIYLETVSSTIAWFENTPGLLTDQYLLEKA